MNKIETVRICAKCSDLCSVVALDKNGDVVLEHDGYVPAFVSPGGYGDYVELDIDVSTGVIRNWSFPTQNQMKNQLTS